MAYLSMIWSNGRKIKAGCKHNQKFCNFGGSNLIYEQLLESIVHVGRNWSVYAALPFRPLYLAQR